MMWSPLPVYQVHKGARRKAQRAVASSNPDSPPPSIAPSAHPAHRNIEAISDLLEPAVDGPPSPERIRALVSKQMKRDRHQSQQTTSSGSSQFSANSWEHGSEHLSLSRKSSQRSNTSSMPGRERPESVQIFGKSLFNRRGKLGRRDSSDHSSSNSSMYSAEQPADFKDPNFMNMFARRKTLSRDEEPSTRKLQISGPYNFQHLTHTPKESISRVETNAFLDSSSDYPAMRSAPIPRNNSSAGIHADNLHFSNFSSEALPILQEDPSAGLHAYAENKVEPHLRINRNLVQPRQQGASPRRLTKRSYSQEQIHVPPPRPPRSPIEYSINAPPPPPPRVSSRASTQHGGSARMGSFVKDRPLTISGLRQPRNFVLPTSPEVPGLPYTGEYNDIPPEQDKALENHGISHAITTPDDAAWPLPSTGTTPLTDVPEEEENYVFPRHRRVSIQSNSSSLRGSVSVPLLRQMPQPQSIATKRPPSNASETLGKFDLFAAQRAMRGAAEADSEYDEPCPESWEDDIDYCYEHNAEADCEFAWDRPSCDLTREGLDQDDVRTLSHGDISPKTIPVYTPPGMLSPPGQYDIPALSPAESHASNGTQEVITPTGLAVPLVTSNFSLPRRDSSTLLLREHKSNMSRAASFKESPGFSLSPSLLIPNDYAQQMALHERDELREQDEDDEFLSHASPALSEARSSASTTNSALSEQSEFSSRHKSTISTSTAYTRWTGCSTSASIDGWQQPGDVCHSTSAEENEHSVALDTLPELDERCLKRDPARERHFRAQSHADFLGKTSIEAVVTDHKLSALEPSKARQRANTTSRSHNPPPVQFGLFPNSPSNVGGQI